MTEEQTDFDVAEQLRKIEEQKERANDLPDDEVYDDEHPFLKDGVTDGC